MQIYVWGTGRLTGKVIGKYISPDEITAYIDNDKKKKSWQGKPVIEPAEILNRDYDAVVVITLHSHEIYEQCKNLGLDLKKVIFLYENILGNDLNQNYLLIEQVFGKEYADVVRNRYQIIRDCEAKKNYNVRGISHGGYFETDYVRMRSFELSVEEIVKRDIPGAVAEVGVFRGEFAQYINGAFPERICYLCDSFEGFQTFESSVEMKNGNATKAFVDAYSDTSVAAVMERMPHPDKIIVRKGFFPETMENIDEQFAFVSLDMDFEESIYEGIKYFYPRLSVGGYIFLHDYHSSLHGVEHAVRRYEKAENAILPKVPLCDANGTLVLTK